MRRILEFVCVCMWKFIIWYEDLPWVQKKEQKEHDRIMYEFVMSRLS